MKLSLSKDLEPLKAAARAKIDAKRDATIAAGSTFAVDGVGPIPVTGRIEDQMTLLALKDSARDMKLAGVTDAILPYRDGANADHLLTPDQMISLTDQGKAWVTAVYQTSWAVKETINAAADPAAITAAAAVDWSAI